MDSAHPRISVNSICSMSQSFEADLALWADLGITNVGLITPKLEPVGWAACLQAISESGLEVSTMSCYLEDMEESLQFTADVGAGVLYSVSG
jgi:hypothetical protein